MRVRCPALCTYLSSLIGLPPSPSPLVLDLDFGLRVQVHGGTQEVAELFLLDTTALPAVEGGILPEERAAQLRQTLREKIWHFLSLCGVGVKLAREIKAVEREQAMKQAQNTGRERTRSNWQASQQLQPSAAEQAQTNWQAEIDKHYQSLCNWHRYVCAKTIIRVLYGCSAKMRFICST